MECLGIMTVIVASSKKILRLRLEDLMVVVVVML